MKISKLNKLLNEGVLTNEEYNLFFNSMTDNGKGELIGSVPYRENAYRKFCLEGDLSNENLLEFVKTKIVPPYEADYIDDLFKKYGIMILGISDYWHWFTKENITDYAIHNGCKPVEEATELELWKMIAICERYWAVSYKEWYYDAIMSN